MFLMTFLPTLAEVDLASRPAAEMTRSEAIARVRTILKESTPGCRIDSVSSVTAVTAKTGWRVTTRIVMSASGRRVAEKAVWLVGEGIGPVAQDQLTSEIQQRCNYSVRSRAEKRRI